MRAVRFQGPGRQLALESVPDPSPGPQDVVVRVEACGVFASDLHLIAGELPLPVPPPITLGHEQAGVIAEVGSEVPVWKEGERVAILAGRSCTQCRGGVVRRGHRSAARGAGPSSGPRADLALDPSEEVPAAIRMPRAVEASTWAVERLASKDDAPVRLLLTP